jgi:Ca-activated chloride channel family protein
MGNRVIVLSDGDANIGRVSHDAMLASIAQHAGQGITLTTVGFGTGNYQDYRMEQLANKGDGVNVYIDSFAEAKRVFGRDLSSTIETLARDVKVQVDFDPDVVRAYRLIGYENRDVADEDFREDAVDGGEMGTGHQVTALYELTLADHLSPETTLATVRIRSKKPGPERPSTERSWTATVADVAPDFASARPSVQRAAVVATFAEKLRGSRHVAELSYGVLLERAQAVSNGGEEDRELLELIQLASQETTALRFRAR